MLIRVLLNISGCPRTPMSLSGALFATKDCGIHDLLGIDVTIFRLLKVYNYFIQVKIWVNVTENTNNITMHAVDMNIDRGFTSIREYHVGNNKTKVVGIVEQRNDTERQTYVIKTSDNLMKGKQYVVHLKFIGYLNDYLQGFYRSSYTVGNETR